MRICITYLLLFTILVSCEKLKEVNQPSSTSELQGKWELKNASCFCFFPDHFDFGAHKLEFDSTADELIVENSDDTFFITDAGTYPIIIEIDRITIKNSIEYNYRIEGKTLILTFIDNPQIADDEILLTYSKL